MNLKHWGASGILLAAALGAQAQQHVHTTAPAKLADPADAGIAVPAAAYVSAMSGYASAQKDLPSPDKAWRAANETVAGQSGHAGHQAPAPDREAPGRSTIAPATGAAPAAKAEKDHQHH